MPARAALIVVVGIDATTQRRLAIGDMGWEILVFWPFKRKSAGKEIDLKATLQESLDRVHRFNDYLLDSRMHEDMRLRDVSRLPWEKDVLHRDFQLLLAAMPEGEYRQAIAVTALSLPYFQEGVGDDIAFHPPELNETDNPALMAGFLAEWEKRQAFQPRIDAETEKIAKIIEAGPIKANG